MPNIAPSFVSPASPARPAATAAPASEAFAAVLAATAPIAAVESTAAAIAGGAQQDGVATPAVADQAPVPASFPRAAAATLSAPLPSAGPAPATFAGRTALAVLPAPVARDQNVVAREAIASATATAPFTSGVSPAVPASPPLPTVPAATVASPVALAAQPAPADVPAGVDADVSNDAEADDRDVVGETPSPAGVALTIPLPPALTFFAPATVVAPARDAEPKPAASVERAPQSLAPSRARALEAPVPGPTKAPPDEADAASASPGVGRPNALDTKAPATFSTPATFTAPAPVAPSPQQPFAGFGVAVSIVGSLKDDVAPSSAPQPLASSGPAPAVAQPALQSVAPASGQPDDLKAEAPAPVTAEGDIAPALAPQADSRITASSAIVAQPAEPVKAAASPIAQPQPLASSGAAANAARPASNSGASAATVVAVIAGKTDDAASDSAEDDGGNAGAGSGGASGHALKGAADAPAPQASATGFDLSASSAGRPAAAASITGHPHAAAQVAAAVVTNVANALSSGTGSRRSRFDVRLDDGDFGRIDVRLDISASGQVSTRLTVDRPETLQMLRHDSGELTRTLERAGFQLGGDGVSFQLRDGGERGGDASRRPQPQIAAIDVPDDLAVRAAPLAYAAPRASASALDVRV